MATFTSLRPMTPVLIVLSVSGCATLKSNTFLGASMGAASGAIAGDLIGSPNHSGTGTLIGAASGALIGGIIGLLTETKSKDTKPVATRSERDPNNPSYTSPEVRKIWVPDKIEGNKFIKGHEEFILERGSVWTMP